jgi:hypothetical protein
MTNGTNTDALNFNGSYVLANFKFASDGNGGTIVYDPPVPPAGDSGTYSSQTPAWPGFNTLNTLGYSQNSNETGNALSSADSSRCALLGNYMASSLVTTSNGYGGMTSPSDVQLGSQSVLANPHHG